MMPRKSFSLRTLFLATTFLAMALAIAILSMQLIPLRQEVKRLRGEAGYLTINDPDKIHAIGIETNSPLIWKWKVYFPPGDGYCGVNAIVGDLPPSGEERKSGGGLGRPSGEAVFATVTARIFKDLQDAWVLKTTLDGGSVSSSIQKELSDAQLEQLRNKKGSTGWRTIGSLTESGDPDQPFVLYRQRFEQGNKGINIDAPGPGVLIWLTVTPDGR